MNMRVVRPNTAEQKHTRSTVDTIEITPKVVASWQLPPFQRELKINAKVEQVAKQIGEDGGVLPGILTLGVLDREVYLVDGQHRAQAFTMSGVEVGYADVRTVFFESMADMAEEFERLNSQLVTLRPDDKLRALEYSCKPLRRIRQKCSFLGYGQVRRGKSTVMMSMATFIRVWVGSQGETPVTTIGATPAALNMSEDDADKAIEFATLCFEAWQRDVEFARLWGGLNMVILAWMYRRTVLREGWTGTTRWTKLTREQFQRGLQALAAEPGYLEFLVGRNAGERDRSPAYNRIRQIFLKRLKDELGRVQFPQAGWTHS